MPKFCCRSLCDRTDAPWCQLPQLLLATRSKLLNEGHSQQAAWVKDHSVARLLHSTQNSEASLRSLQLHDHGAAVWVSSEREQLSHGYVATACSGCKACATMKDHCSVSHNTWPRWSLACGTWR